jgi:hypothetical protein
MNTNWNPVTLTDPANDGLDYTLDGELAEVVDLGIKRHIKERNARDKAAMQAASRGDDARLGVHWDEPA